MARQITNSCQDCAFADWEQTSNGRRHPSGDGRCQWTVPSISLPKAFRYLVRGDRMTENAIPQPDGGWIGWHEPHTDCPAWESKKGTANA